MDELNSNDYKVENYSEKTIESSKTSGIVLSSALAWFGYGLLIIFSVAFAITEIPMLKKLTSLVIRNRVIWLALTVIMIGIMFVMSMKATSLKVLTLIALYTIFCLYMSLIMAIIFSAYAKNLSSLLLVLTIPGLTMGIMGTIGYLQIFDFSKIGRFLFFSLIGLIIMNVVLMFVRNELMMYIYCSLGYIIFTLYAGFDMWRIRQSEKFLEQTGQINDKKLVRKLGIVFGLSLLTDYINLVLFLVRFIRS